MKVINPGLPEPYCYESDYRKIPREYLNPRIPLGRTNVKWRPFKTLPEQYEQLEQYIQDQNKIDRPILTEEQLQIFNEKLSYKIETNSPISIDYYDDGYVYSVKGYVKKVDMMESKLIITNKEGNEVKNILLDSIVNLD